MTEFLFAAVLFAMSFVFVLKYVALIFRIALDEIADDCPRNQCWRFARELKRKSRIMFPDELGYQIELQGLRLRDIFK